MKKTFPLQWSCILFLSLLISLSVQILASPSPAEELLAPIRTDTPRDTMRSFLTNMNRYREAMEKGVPGADRFLSDATRTLNLEEIPVLMRDQEGPRAAVFLKEVIDRVILIDYELIPGDDEAARGELPARWRLKGTEITIRRIQSGDRSGEYLFTADTVSRAAAFYDRVRSLPYLPGSGRGALYETPWMEETLPSWSMERFIGIFWWQWLGILALILAGLVLRTLVRFLLNFLALLASRTRFTLDERIASLSRGPADLFLMGVFWFFSLKLLRPEGEVLAYLSLSIRAVISISLIWGAYRLSSLATDYFRKMAGKTESTLDDQLVPLLNRSIRVFTVLLGSLMAIQNLGVNVLSLLAGLGIGGIAFALAAKDTVANFFGSIMILFDSPFQVGDWIVLGSVEGTVEEIGFRSTRIRTFYNSLVTVPNSDLMNARIDNMGRREYRRIRTILGLTYDTSPQKMEAFLEGVKNIVLANPNTRKDYFHVVFHSFGSHSLDVMLYCFLKVPDWSNELVERQNLFLEILRLAEDLGVRFAFPTSTLHVESLPSPENPEPGRDPNGDESPEGFRKLARDYGPGGSRSSPEGQGVFVPPFRENP